MIHLLRSAGFESGASVTPVADLLQSLGPGLLEQAHAVASMLEFVDVGPNLGLPGLIVHCRLSTARAPSMELSHNSHCGGHCSRQFDKNAADFLNIIIIANEVFVAQQIAKSQLARFHFRLGAGVKGPVFRAQLFGGITRHPESFLVRHLPLEVARRTREASWLPHKQLGCRATSDKPFSQKIVTIDVSRRGVKLSKVQAQIKIGETIGMTYGQTKGRFVVRWVGAIGTARAGQIGIEYTSPEKPFWGVPLPEASVDDFGRQTGDKDRRRHIRIKSINSVELHPQGETSRIWGKATDLSLGGCFVEMPIPLKQGTTIKMALWLNETKL